ncbi:hypothetical protein AB832_07105 [Flavobacteriaceae bacterium (ex Bugula neritina AB1)]|nr:hypothetical protein AB832_07105 [Flavobacteriaceae bacterium (ex Bugula neritina AB1)]
MINNKFWNYIYQKESSYTVEAVSLEEAIRKVISVSSEKYSFRFHEGLIDLNGHFKFFQFQEQKYILKIVPSIQVGEQEIINSKEFNNRLINHNKYSASIPELFIINNNIILCNKYLGVSYHENYKETIGNEFYQILIDLLASGIIWEGFAPRNILCGDGTKYYFIDFEDTFFVQKTVRQIPNDIVFKWTLNWNQIFKNSTSIDELVYFLKERSYLTTNSFYLDSFEKAYGILYNNINIKSIKRTTREITLISEKDLPNNNKLPFDLGHTIDEIFSKSPELSVFFTVASYNLRKRLSDETYKKYLENTVSSFAIFIRENELFLKASIDRDLSIYWMLISIIISLGKIQENEHTLTISFEELKHTRVLVLIESYKSLINKTGLSNAVKRALYVEELINNLFLLVRENAFPEENFDLIIRGSLANGLLTTQSDIDFEVSSEEFPTGHPGLEWVIQSIIIILLKIPCEGSYARPKEIDIIGLNGTRDLHEWLELRRINQPTIIGSWIEKDIQNVPPGFWWKKSIYEKSNPPITPKYLFLKIRTFILRISRDFHLCETSIIPLIENLRNKLSPNFIDQLKNLLELCIIAYEADDIEKEQLINMDKDIDKCISYYREKIQQTPPNPSFLN